jgi:hypothetical protein
MAVAEQRTPVLMATIRIDALAALGEGRAATRVGLNAGDSSGLLMPPGVSPLSPFRHRAFRVVWTATLISNVGAWMQSAAGGWLMTTVAPEPRMVALVQVASALPMFLLGLPAGALADLFDQRRLLLTMEIVGTAVTAGFAFLVAQGLVEPTVLLVFVILTSAAAAAIAPAWQAIVPQLVVRKEDLVPAVALDSVSVNISRAVGPALNTCLCVEIESFPGVTPNLLISNYKFTLSDAGL